MPHCPGSALVVCIGNELVADDAAGYEVYRSLRKQGVPDGVRLEYVGVGGLALLDLLSGDEEALIVVDAVQFGAPAGTIHRLPWEQLPLGNTASISAHGIGLRETIDVGKIVSPEKLPSMILLIGIEGRCFNQMREAMTAATAAAVPGATASVLQELHSLRKGM
jgi:hydrogenase maturation protease